MTTEEPSPAVWIEIRVEVDNEAVEPVVELFSQYGYNHGVAIEEPFTQDSDGDNVRVDIMRPFTIRSFLPAESFTPELKERLEQSLWYLGQIRPVGPLTIASHLEEDWENAWKAHFVPVQASRKILIAPPWNVVDPEPGAHLVILDPGMAFGTGTHPTTRLALELLEDVSVGGARVLDAGTGTGVLAIAAMRLGARAVDAADIDPVSVRQARGNVLLNGMEQSITVWEDDFSRPPAGAPYDLVIANIIARVLNEIQETLVASMSTDGTLILSGMIDSKEQDVVDCYERAGLRLVARRQMADWVGHIWTRR